MGAIQDIQDAARGFACGIYQNIPGAIIPNPIADALHLFWDGLCAPPGSPGLPAPPVSPFNGGQCVGVVYRVKVRKIDLATGNITGEPSTLIAGAIVGIKSQYNPDNGITTTFLLGGGGTGSPEYWTLDTSTVGVQHRYEYIFIQRLDGGADNCGNPPKAYPPAPSVPPEGYTSPPINITLEDGDDIDVTFNFTPPVAIELPTLKPPSLTINVKSPTLNIPLTFEFNGEVNIGPPLSQPGLPPDVVNTINNIDNNTTNTNNTANNTNNTLNKFYNTYNFNTSPPPFATDPDVVKSPIGEAEDGDKDEPGLLGVLVKLTKLPDKVQFGNPNVYFAGWVSFKSQDGYLPREQINFKESYFIAPPGSTGFSYTFTNQSKGEVVLYSKPDEGSENNQEG